MTLLDEIQNVILDIVHLRYSIVNRSKQFLKLSLNRL